MATLSTLAALPPRQKAALFAALTAAWTVWTLLANYNGLHLDISALFMAGWLTGTGQPDLIYLAPTNEQGGQTLAFWSETMASLGLPDQVVTAYLYPPIWAKLLAYPAHGLGPTGFFHAAYIWHMAAILASAALAWGLSRSDRAPEPTAWGLTLFVILFATWPVVLAFLTNQPQLTVTLLVLAAFLLTQRGHAIPGGALLGLAAAFKVSPILFALIFVLNRNWRALSATLVVSGGIALLSIAVMGWPLHEVYLARLAHLRSLIVMTKVNYSPEALLYQFSDLIRGLPMVDGRELTTFMRPEPLWITLTTKLAFLASLVTMILATRRLPPATRPVVQLFLMGLITALFGPLSWAHYFILPMLLFPALFTIMEARRAWLWIAAVLVSASLPAFAVLNALNHLFMVSALVPALVFLGLLADSLRTAARATP